MDILLASNNAHKARELTSIFAPDRVMTPDQIGLHFAFEETGDTFFANAHGKAEALRLLCDGAYVVVADDSGICVDALGGAPGVYSARFGRDVGVDSDEARTALLLEHMTGKTDRGAHYVCSMVAVLGPERFLCAQETWHGEIAHERSTGTGGFGYDPVFRPTDRGCTVADISDDEKHALSHRGKAARALRGLLAANGV